MTRWLGLVLVVLVWAAPVQAAALHCYGPYPLTSNNYAPDSTGADVTDFAGDFSVQLAITSGSLTVSVESQLASMGNSFASLGTMNSSSVTQFHGPLSRLRFSVSACSSCVASVTACANSIGP